MPQGTFEHPCASTGTIWTLAGGVEGVRIPNEEARAKKGMYHRVTQPQGDCLYLCFIGLLQSEKAKAQAAHLESIRRFAVDSANLFDGAVWGTIVQDWKTLNVKHPGPYPVQAVQPLRRIVATFLEQHFEYYWNGGDEFDSDPPGFFKKASPVKEDFRVVMRQELKELSAHFATWHPETGQVIDQNDTEAARSAYCRMIQMQYPNGEPIQQREMNATQLGAVAGEGVVPYENVLNFGDQLEVHVAAQLFGVDINIFVWLQGDETPTWEDGRLQTSVVAKDKSAPGSLNSTPWLLMNKNGMHYDYFETSKTAGYVPRGGAGGDNSDGTKKTPKVRKRAAENLHDAEEDEDLKMAIALSLGKNPAGFKEVFDDAMEAEEYKMAMALSLAGAEMTEDAQLRDAVVQFRQTWRARLGQALNRKEDVRIEDAAIENEMKARVADASNGKGTAVQWAILRLLAIQSFVQSDYELPALTKAFEVFLEMRLEENENDPHIAALAVQQHMHENNP